MQTSLPLFGRHLRVSNVRQEEYLILFVSGDLFPFLPTSADVDEENIAMTMAYNFSVGLRGLAGYHPW